MTKRTLVMVWKCLWPVPVVAVAFAGSSVGIGRVAAQQPAPGAAACTALGPAMFTALATLTATYVAAVAAAFDDGDGANDQIDVTVTP